jgi:Spy/CpxP family protein refolding chaperone
MKRFLLNSGLAAVAFAAMTLSAYADDRPAAVLAGHGAGGHGHQRLRRCLATVDLSADQKAAIAAIVAAAKPTLQADAQTVKADHEKIHADISSGADKSVVGQDVLTAHADAEKLRADEGAVHDQIVAKLTPDQQTKLTACLASGPRGHGPDRFRSHQ